MWPWPSRPRRHGRAARRGSRPIGPRTGSWTGAHGPRVFVLEPTQEPWRESAPVKARFRVTLETLSDAAAQTDQRPGEDVALAIQAAATRAGRKTWFTADWTADGKLDGADI